MWKKSLRIPGSKSPGIWQNQTVFPVWLIALVLAAAAPVFVRLIASVLEKNARERTAAVAAEIRAKRKRGQNPPRTGNDAAPRK